MRPSIERDRALIRTHEGRRYYVCSAASRQKFRENPKAALRTSQAARKELIHAIG